MHNVTALRKRHFLALCRTWHSRCDVWKRAAAAEPPLPRKRGRAAGEVGRAPPPVPPPAPSPFETAAVHALRELSPCVTAYKVKMYSSLKLDNMPCW